MNGIQFLYITLAVTEVILSLVVVSGVVLLFRGRRGGEPQNIRLGFTKTACVVNLSAVRNGRTIWCCTIFICAVCITCILAGISLYALSFLAPDATIHAVAKNDVRFKAYYLENDIFGKGARPGNLQYLMSFTDYIEIENAFSAEFSQETDVSYRYSAVETLMIKYQKGTDSNNNPTVFEKKTAFSTLSGSITGSKISWDGADADSPGGVYMVEPKTYIDIYRQFVKEQQAQMKKDEAAIDKTPSFIAELSVDFTYNIRTADKKINETLTRGIIIPLSLEVFSIETTGTPESEFSVVLRKFSMPGLLSIVLLVLLFAAHTFGICYSIWRLTMEKDKSSRKVNRILKKYSDEIIVSAEPADLSGYKIIPVLQFKELLKLAINLNKHILCFHDDEKAEFCAFADGYAFCFNLICETEGDIPEDGYTSTEAETIADETEDLRRNT